MSTAQSVASSVARSVATSVAGSGGGVVPDPYGPELLTNPELAGYVAGSPGTPPTGWTALLSGGSLAAPVLTFGVAANRRAIFQSKAVTPGVFKADVTATLNSGSAAVYDVLYYAAPTGSTAKYFLDGVEVAASTAWTGTKTLKIEITAINSGNIEFRLGAGVVGARTQNVTLSNPSLKKAV